MNRRLLVVCVILSAVTLTWCATAQAASLSIFRAKQAISTQTYLTFGGTPKAYGARSCRRLAPNKVSCVGWIDDGKTTCSDRMKAVKRNRKIEVTGVAAVGDWNCRRD